MLIQLGAAAGIPVGIMIAVGLHWLAGMPTTVVDILIFGVVSGLTGGLATGILAVAISLPVPGWLARFARRVARQT